ncbi:MAG: recombinase family protein [Ktedonobacterales bacterium]
MARHIHLQPYLSVDELEHRFYVFEAMAEFERDIVRERMQAGLEAARARGRCGSRPKATTTMEPRNLACAKAFYLAKQKPFTKSCR